MPPGPSAGHGGEQLASFDLFSADDVSATVEIQPCRACGSWYVEVAPVDLHRIVFREWHEQDCPHLRSLLDDGLADAD